MRRKTGKMLNPNCAIGNLMPEYSKKLPKTKDLFAFTDSNRKSLLYIATNIINGNQYIGITRTTLDQRKRKHFASAARGERGRFYNAIRKYGSEIFDFVEVKSFETFKDASAAERKKIAEMRPAYNVTKGGEGALGYKHDDASIALMRAAKVGKKGPWLGKKRPQETIDKIRKARLENPLRYWLGKKRDQATIDKIAATKKSTPRREPTAMQQASRRKNIKKASSAKCKPVICLTTEQVFLSAKDASLAFGLGKTAVAAVCNANGKRKAVYGLKFSYMEVDAK